MAELKKSYDHVIVGGGVVADKAARAIHDAEPDATVAILSAADVGPVYRPALSKELWMTDDHDPESQDLNTASEADAEVHTGTTVTSIDADAHTVTTDGGATVEYGTLLVATGSSPRTLDGAADDDRVVYLREVADYRRLRALATKGATIAVVGDGYIGCEIAAGLSTTGADVTLYFHGDHMMERLFPASIVEHLEEVYRSHGITLVPNFKLASVDAGDQLTLTSENGDTATADAAVLGFGAELNTDLAEKSGLTMADGCVDVDDHLRTSADDVWAAGDIVHFNDPVFGPRHTEHVDHAWESGTTAGKNMTGGDETYEYTPSIFSDLFDDGFEAIGSMSTDLEVKEVWNDDRSAAVVWYLDDDKVQGVLLWNTWDQVPAAREAAAASRRGDLSPEDLASQITPGG